MKTIMYNDVRIKMEKGFYSKKNYKGKLHGELVRVLYYEVKEVMKDLHDWIPVTEHMLTTFLSKHPEKISEDAKLIGFEIFNTDILFEDSNNLYVIECKRDNGNSKAVVINNAIPQLEKYCNIIEQQGINKKLIPIVAIMGIGIKEYDKRKREKEKERETKRIKKEKEKEIKRIERNKEIEKKRIEEKNKRDKDMQSVIVINTKYGLDTFNNHIFNK